MRKYIEASQGMVLTDGAIFGKKILIAEGIDPNTFYEITEAEAEITEEEAEKLLNEEATEE